MERNVSEVVRLSFDSKNIALIVQKVVLNECYLAIRGTYPHVVYAMVEGKTLRFGSVLEFGRFLKGMNR